MPSSRARVASRRLPRGRPALPRPARLPGRPLRPSLSASPAAGRLCLLQAWSALRRLAPPAPILVFAAEGELRCSACARTITGEYLELDGKPYCSQACLDTALPRCAACGKVLRGEHLIQEGKPYCSRSCLSADLPRCSVCYRTIEGEYLVSGDRIFCGRDCLAKTLPRCAACGRAVQSWVEIEGTAYCQECAGGERCFACGHPGKTSRLGDGRRICRRCLSSAVLEQGEAERIFSTVREKMDRGLGLATDHRISLALVDRDELEAHYPEATGGREQGFYHFEAETTTTWLVDRDGEGREVREKTAESTRQKFHVEILEGLPAKRYIEVAAHELAHDWMYANLPGIKEPRLVEGFAEYVASRVNILFDHEELNRRMESSPDPVYGEGYRQMRRMAEKEGGLDGLIRRLAAREGE